MLSRLLEGMELDFMSWIIIVAFLNRGYKVVNLVIGIASLQQAPLLPALPTKCRIPESICMNSSNSCLEASSKYSVYF